MGYSLHIRNFRLPEVDQKSIKADQVAYFSVVEMPFRLRLGKFFRYLVDRDKNIEIAGFNRIDLPKKITGTPVEQIPFQKDRPLLNTRLVVIENSPRLDKGDLEAIQKAEPFPQTIQAADILKQAPDPQLLRFPDDNPLMAIRRLVDLYHKACPSVYGGDMVRPVWLHDFMSSAVVFGLCLRSSAGSIPDNFAKALLSSENPNLGERDMGALFWRDAVPAQKRRLARSLSDGTSASLTDHMLLLSHAYQEQHNMEMAVITAIAGLEAAFFVFAQKRLEPKLGKELTPTFLREQGASTLMLALPRLYFSVKNMPTKDEFDDVSKAIKARNDIMHGKLDRSGKPNYLNKGHLGRAILACNKLTLAFQRESG